MNCSNSKNFNARKKVAFNFWPTISVLIIISVSEPLPTADGDWARTSSLGTGTRYKLEILHECGKRVETKNQKVLGSNSYVCISYKGKTGMGAFLFPSILNRVKKRKRGFIELKNFQI